MSCTYRTAQLQAKPRPHLQTLRYLLCILFLINVISWMKEIIKVPWGSKGRGFTVVNFWWNGTPSSRRHTTARTAPLHKFHFISSSFQWIHNRSGTELFSSFLYRQGLMNTSLHSPLRTIAGTCGLQNFGKKTLTAGSSVHRRKKIPAGNAQVRWQMKKSSGKH